MHLTFVWHWPDELPDCPASFCPATKLFGSPLHVYHVNIPSRVVDLECSVTTAGPIVNRLFQIDRIQFWLTKVFRCYPDCAILVISMLFVNEYFSQR